MKTVTDLFFETGKIYVDNSILSALATCETAAMMKYGYHLRPIDESVAPLKAGTAVHKALEVHYCGGTVNEALNALFVSYYDWAMANVIEGDRLCYTNVVEIVKSWIWRNPVSSLPYTIMRDETNTPMVELAFALDLTDDIVFVGAIDAVATRTDGEGVILIDTKSTGRIDKLFMDQFYIGSQMSGYAWALRQLIGRPITSIYINVVDMRTVPNSDRKCREHRTPYTECGYTHMQHQLAGPYYRSDSTLNTWKKNAVRLGRQWKALLERNGAQVDIIPQRLVKVAQSGMFRYNTCNRCSFHDFCRKGRNLESTDDSFTYEPWYPGPTKELCDG